jgi:TrpR family transcriptional regulator, trp operon repressor
MSNGQTKDNWGTFLKLCSQMKSQKDFKDFFDLFLTIEEKEALLARFKIVKALLEKKLPQREISKKFKVSIAQITRGSNALKIIKKPLKEFLEKNL